MQVSTTYPTDTTIKLTITGDKETLDSVKAHVVKELSARVGSVPGFRKGKVPAALAEKQLDQNLLQSEFLEHAINELYGRAAEQERLRIAGQPSVSITKFVPYDTLELEVTVDVIGKVELADYKKIKLEKPKVSVTAKDVDEVIDNLRSRTGEKHEVDRAAKDGDEVVIDFAGVDAKTKEPIAGTEGKEYPLPLGSKSFIPGFEEALVGVKAGEEKTFDVTFPKDYGVKALQSKKVTFTVKVHKVQENALPKLDDAFAATVGPFKTVAELKADIKKQVTAEREREADRTYENQLIEAIAKKTKVAIPKSAVDEQIQRMEQEEKQNLTYRGQTWEQHLELEGVTEDEHREKNREQAELHVKAGIILGEVAEREQLTVTPEEVDLQVNLLKGQYQDEKMQAELDKPENRRDILSRILTQKTVAKLVEYASK